MKIEHQHICLVQRLAIDAEAFRIFGQQLRTDIHSVADQLRIVGIVKKRQVLGHRAAGWNPVAVADHQNIANRNTAAIHSTDVEVGTDVASDIRIELTVFQRQTSHIVAGATYGEVRIATIQQIYDIGAFEGIAGICRDSLAAIRPWVFDARDRNHIVTSYYK